MMAVILLYHSIAENEPADPYAVSRNAFCDQISWFIDQGYECVSLAALVQSLRNSSSVEAGKQVVLTFDDGFQDFILNAFPILQRHQLPATVFLVTGMLGKRAIWSASAKQALLMTEKEARFVRSNGISLGSHTLDHADLTTLAADELRRQLVSSRAALADLGERFHSFSYPWGKCGEREVAAVRSAGYECAVKASAARDSLDDNAYLLSRIPIHRGLDWDAFKRAVMGPTLLERMAGRARHFVRRALGGASRAR